MRLFFVGFFRWLNSIIHRPLKVLWFCLALAFVNLVVDGSLLRLWGLHRDFSSTQDKIKNLTTQSAEIDKKLVKAADPSFIEREAIDRLDLVNEGDLVFVFSDED